MQSIEWRPIPGFEGIYDISEFGDVLRITRSATSRPGPIKHAVHPKNGYHRVDLRKDGKYHFTLIHRAVAMAFIGEPTGPVVRHLDGNPGNNHHSNLAYGTYSENSFDTVRHGRNKEALKTHCKHGHPFDAANTGTRPDRPGSRVCLTCQRNHSAEQRLLKKKGRTA